MNIFNLRPNVNMQSSVRVNLSAHEWFLNTEKHNRHTIESVANYLNRRFNDGYNRGLSRDDLQCFVHQLMEDFSIYGANDTEPRNKLDDLLNLVYP